MNAEPGDASVTVDPGTPDGPGRATLSYRPHLDGLRAVAVALVVAFHSGLGVFDGGYIGVDVFFVLSGFLVTRLLLTDVRSHGRIDLRRFYARRFRRLLPAAATVLVVTAAVFSALATRIEVAETAGSFRAAFLYVANWHFIREGTGYFAADLDRNPVLHFWSLAVEEQFYLVWPLALTGLLVATRNINGRRRLRTIAAIVAVAAVASAVWAVALRTRDPLRSYYGTDARAYQLLAGALLALTSAALRRARRYPAACRTAATITLLTTIAVATRLVDLGPTSRGLVTTVLTVTLLAALEGTGGGLTRSALSRPTLVELGRISYGIYLWHWPVIWVLTDRFAPTPLQTFVITSLVATGLAAASTLLLEQPVRTAPRLDHHRTAVIATGLTLSLLGGLVIVPTITDRATRTTALTGTTPTVTGTDPRTYNLDDLTIDPRELLKGCFGGPPQGCVLRRGHAPHVMVIGDSNAYALLPAFREIARRNDLTLSAAVSAGCPWQRGLGARPDKVDPNATLLFARVCPGRQAEVYNRLLAALKPDIVVAVNVAYERDTPGHLHFSADERTRTSPRAAQEDSVRGATRSATRAIRATGARLVLVEPIPVPTTDFNPRSCLAEATTTAACRYIPDTEATFVERDYRALARADDSIVAMDIDRLVCPYLPICDPIVDGRVVKGDHGHLAPEFARSLAPAIERYLRDRGVLPR